MAKSTVVSKTVKKPIAKKATKKAAPSKAVSVQKPEKKERSINIKYADKSEGQPELLEIFEAIKKLMLPYDKKRNLVMHMGTGGQANLVSHKPVVIAGRTKEEIWFVSALVQKGYVGFYYMPVYMNDPIKKRISPELLKCLKGKACFHIKKKDASLLKDIDAAIKIGYDAFVKMGWM
ncbi:MAG: DUF1801 domain-containing protein [Bacteroidota bacterium]